jgi:hypothetical protein
MTWSYERLHVPPKYLALFRPHNMTTLKTQNITFFIATATDMAI